MKKYLKKDIIIFWGMVLFSGILSVIYGIERTYDTRNYHLYNPYAFLNGRVGYDIMPAGIQSYFNPLLDIPYYLTVKYFNDYPALITFFMGFSYALFLFIIYKIARFIFKDYYPMLWTPVCVITVAGIWFMLRCLGWLSHDIFLGDLMLISLYYVLKRFDQKYSAKSWAVVGLLCGIAVGLKYTMAIFVVPFGVVLLLFCRHFEKPFRSFGLCGAFAAFGFLLADGFWMYQLYTTFGNPFFPYFNEIFQSSEIAVGDVFSIDFKHHMPNGFKKVLLYPLKLPDIRFKILWWSFVINILLFPFIRRRSFWRDVHVNIAYADFIFVWVLGAYLFWIYTFGVPRYLVFILGLSPIIGVMMYLEILYLLKKIFSFLRKIIPIEIKHNFSHAECFCACIICILALLFLSPNFAPIKEKKLIRFPIGEKLLTVENLNIPDQSIILLGAGTGIILPFQNPDVRYIKVNPLEFSRRGRSLFSDDKMSTIRKMIDEKKDKLYLIATFNLSQKQDLKISAVQEKLTQKLNQDKKVKPLTPEESAIYELDRLGISIPVSKCCEIHTNMVHSVTGQKHAFYFCEVHLKPDEL